MGATIVGPSSFEANQGFIAIDEIAFVDVDRLHRAFDRRGDLVFHFHRFNHDQRFFGGDGGCLP